MRFEFAAAGRILIGPGTLAEVAPLAAGLGRRPFVVTGESRSRAAPLLEQLAEHGLDVLTFSVGSEPATDLVLAGLQYARQAGCDLVIGIGGGSVVDTAKAIAALLTSGGEPHEREPSSVDGRGTVRDSGTGHVKLAISQAAPAS